MSPDGGESPKPMYFPISGVHLNPIYLISVGFIIGVLGGFFGVGGSFLTAPALFAAGLPMNFVVGTDLAHIIGTISGSEAGVQAIEILKKGAHVELVVGTVSIIVFTGISIFCAWESWMALRINRTNNQGGQPTENRKEDVTAIDGFAKALQRIKLAPQVSLPHSGIDSISFWTILFVSFIGGIFSGFLGGGAGYIRMPSMVYLLGIPTHIAVGTDLFEIIISASYGTIRHAMNGNVDIVIALVMQTGAALGARIGANLTQYFTGPRIRLAFAPLPLLGAIVIAQKLLTSHHP
jgi:uncharacterized membrane protein YfcA